MKQNEFHELVLRELREVKADVKEVRQTDIPSLKTDLAVQKATTDTRIDELGKKVTWSSRCYTALGGAIAILLAKFTGGSH